MTQPTGTAPLAGVRVIDCSLLSAGAAAVHLADLGAEVIKVESPEGDYVRSLTWPIIMGSSLLHHHVSRGKKSLTLDLRTPGGVDIFRDLVRRSDVVIEAMRPGALARRGLGFEDLRVVKPSLVFCSLSGYGLTGPYRDAPAHGLAFDSWAGLVKPAVDAEGFCYIPEHPSTGMHAGPILAALAITAALVRARSTGQGAFIDHGQSDAAAYMDWLRIESWKAYERPESEVTGNATDDYVRRAPGTAGMEKGVRYQYYATADGHLLFMASEQVFWQNFCRGLDRMDLFERWPGKQYGDHAPGNRELQAILRGVFATRTTREWMHFAVQWNTAIAPVNTPRTIAADPQFQQRFKWLPASEHVADMLPFPVHFVGEERPGPTPAPAAGQHNDEVLTDVLGYSKERIAAIRDSGALG